MALRIKRGVKIISKMIKAVGVSDEKELNTNPYIIRDVHHNLQSV